MVVTMNLPITLLDTVNSNPLLNVMASISYVSLNSNSPL